MKRVAIALLAGVAAVAGLGYSASAADLAVAAPPPPAPSWTGFYLGVHAGLAVQESSSWTFQDPNGVITPVNLGQVGNQGLGAVGGLQAGYNWQFAQAWVAGIEGDISWSSLSDHRTATPLTFGGAAGGIGGPGGIVAAGVLNSSVSMTATTNWLSSLRARLGYVGWWNTMFYATGGVAWANIEYTGTEANVPPTFATVFLSNTSHSDTKTGWVAGAGAEWMATSNILLRLEYLYYNLSSGNSASAFLVPNPGAFPAAFNYTWSNYNVQVVRIAGSYKF
jgi:outer membrane immunogenic protein